MLETLYAKTFLILGGQLVVTWLSTILMLGWFRRLYYAKTAWVDGETTLDGQLDIDLDWEFVKPYFWALLVLDVVVFFALLNYRDNMTIGLPLFTLWSVLTGFELALCLVSVDENLGGKVLALTALITLAAGLIGAQSGIDFSFLRGGLFSALLLLIGFGLIRIFFSIPRWIQRLGAFAGVIVFTGYLLFDFNRLSKASAIAAADTWPTAMRLAISIYLDIINLFLDLLDLLSKH
ncbi:MAG TPA: Bax inhibitor-1 family protein [Rhodocyclaceae bacterium]|nr:Bax inhibitor-1 family protein [Rhodocyclaceae bacterium]